MRETGNQHVLATMLEGSVSLETLPLTTLSLETGRQVVSAICQPYLGHSRHNQIAAR